MAWFLFGMFAWACVLGMSALTRRVAPEQGRVWYEELFGGDWTGMSGGDSSQTQRERDLEREVEQLKQRVETLETIVTDRKFQWESELNR